MEHGWVGVVSVSGATPAQRASFRGIVSSDRADQADRYWQDRDRLLCLAAGAFARIAIGSALGLDGDALTFLRGYRGKPVCAQLARDGWDFNIAHTEGWIACAIGPGRVGVDIEAVGRIELAALDAFLNPAESARLRVSNATSNTVMGYWTIREAYVKYLGEGVFKPAASFEITGLEPVPQILDQGRCRTDLATMRRCLGPVELAAVSDVQLEFKQFDLEWLAARATDQQRNGVLL
jgi:phosphopantetheinyl transferase